MVVVKKHYLPPTKLVPNSKYPLLEYPGLFSGEQLRADKIFEKLASNGWEGQWVLRYAENQPAHYHSETHECMVVLHGSAKIRFGTADTSDDDEANRHGDGMEEGGLIVEVKPGDAFINPAGLSHKVFDSPPGSHFEILTPGGARKIDVENPHEALRKLSDKLDGFVMLGGYPIGSRWNFNKGGEHEGDYESVWDVPKPAHDPFLGDAEEGLVGQWRFAGSGKKWHARHDSGRDEAIWDELQNNR